MFTFNHLSRWWTEHTSGCVGSAGEEALRLLLNWPKQRDICLKVRECKYKNSKSADIWSKRDQQSANIDSHVRKSNFWSVNVKSWKHSQNFYLRLFLHIFKMCFLSTTSVLLLWIKSILANWVFCSCGINLQCKLNVLLFWIKSTDTNIFSWKYLHTLSSFSNFKGRYQLAQTNVSGCYGIDLTNLSNSTSDGELSNEENKQCFCICQAMSLNQSPPYWVNGCDWPGPKQVRDKSVWMGAGPDSNARAKLTWAHRFVWCPG